MHDSQPNAVILLEFALVNFGTTSQLHTPNMYEGVCTGIHTHLVHVLAYLIILKKF